MGAALDDAARLWDHVFGDQPHLLALFSGYYKAESAAWRCPRRASTPATGIRSPGLGRPSRTASTARCTFAHQLLGEQRTKEQAAPLWTLFADVDSGDVEQSPIRPTAVVGVRRPGHAHVYARLNRAVPPRRPAAQSPLGTRLRRRSIRVRREPGAACAEHP